MPRETPARHPMETLSFFEIKSDMTSHRDYLQAAAGIQRYLLTFLHEPGNLIAAHFDPNSERAYFKRSRASFERKMSANYYVR